MKRLCRAVRAHTGLACLALLAVLMLSVVLGISLGPVTSARAQAQRCFCPPESSLGLFSSLSGRPRSASRDLARSRRAFLSTPEYTAGRATFSVADSVESRL